MQSFLSEKQLRIALIVVNVLFIVSGVCRIGYGVYQNSQGTKGLVDDIEDNEAGSGTTSIVSGSVDIILGIFGLIGAMQKKRLLLMIFAALLILAIISNLVSMIIYGVGYANAKKDANDAITENLKTMYGVAEDGYSIEFTLSIDAHQKADGCCGWSSDGSKNIFLETPWYKSMNNNSKQDPFTLPDSCCMKIATECQRTSNIQQAREKQFVYEMDCMEKLNGRVRVFIAFTLTQLAIVTLMQILCVTITGLHLWNME